MKRSTLVLALALACAPFAPQVEAATAAQRTLAIKKPAAGAGTWLVTWNAPLYESGLNVASAAGTPTSFTVKWGATAGGPYPNSHTTANGSTLSYTITGLTTGTWFVVVVANNAAGESEPGYEETKVVP
jgi:hypothetical protein